MNINYENLKNHVLKRLLKSCVGEQPYYHMYIEEILPKELYSDMKSIMIEKKNGGWSSDRNQDNPNFSNRRYNLISDSSPAVEVFHKIFSSIEIKKALIDKFYLSPTHELYESIKIHEEFEFTFTEPQRFQNIHIDIPAKFLSLVFYFPEGEVSAEEEEKNATILYDKNLSPKYGAKYRENSVCIFAPHFYSYHGFSSTISRDVLVMFYVQDIELKKWQTIRSENRDVAPFDTIKKLIKDKCERYPLVEYKEKLTDVSKEMEKCKINAPRGRVIN